MCVYINSFLWIYLKLILPLGNPKKSLGFYKAFIRCQLNNSMSYETRWSNAVFTTE